MYEHEVEMRQAGRTGFVSTARWNLVPEDWRWLRDLSLGKWKKLRRVWEDAYRLASAAHENGELPEAEWQAFLATVEQHIPGLPAEFEEGRQRYEAERREEERERQERQRRHPPPKPLADYVAETLADERMDAGERMVNLAATCFAGFNARGEIVGGWDDLEESLQRRVLDVCRQGLDERQPTEIPPTGLFSGLILAEGEAFSRVVLASQQAGWPDGPAICRWLPSALFADMSGNWPELIRACWAASKPATAEVLKRTVGEYARRFEEPFQIRMIPEECWVAELTEELEATLRDNTVSARACAELLGQMVQRHPERADCFAIEWAKLPIVDGDDDRLRKAGRNALLVLAPGTLFDLIEAELAERRDQALEELTALWGEEGGFRTRWEQWSVDMQERLASLLLGVYPFKNDPEWFGGVVTPARELRHVRHDIISRLMQCAEPAAQTALDRLGALDPMVQEWVATCRALTMASGAVETFELDTSPDPDVLAVAEAVRLLDRAGYRLIRSADDLLDAVTEALREVESDVGHDLPMLYEKPKRYPNEPVGTEVPRGHLNEDALQAYLRLRLSNHLPEIASGIQAVIVREDQVAYRRKLDLRVMARCHGSERLAILVIEIKWSDNDETRTGLVEQLGRRYLLGENLTHGIFLVGWTGSWSSGEGAAANHDRSRLQENLVRQRDEFCKVGQPGAGLRIEPFVLDVRRSRDA